MRAHMHGLAEQWDPATELVQFRTDAGQGSAQARSLTITLSLAYP
jgi:hypothetical protein